MLWGKLICVYQMPKTGSQTVEATLRLCALPHRIIRFHYLSAERAAEVRRGPQNNASPDAWQKVAAEELRLIANVTRIIRLRKLLSRVLPIPRIEVISAVREPIGSALSSIFENLSYFFPHTSAITPESCAEVVQRPRMMRSYQNWIDLETRAVLGIDVYAHPFPVQRGFQIYENRFARLLVYRFDFLNLLPAILEKFLGCPVKELVNANLGSSKPYAPLYAEMKRKLQLPTDFLNREYGSKMMLHFYSASERETLMRTWGPPVRESTVLRTPAGNALASPDLGEDCP